MRRGLKGLRRPGSLQPWTSFLRRDQIWTNLVSEPRKLRSDPTQGIWPPSLSPFLLLTIYSFFGPWYFLWYRFNTSLGVNLAHLSLTIIQPETSSWLLCDANVLNNLGADVKRSPGAVFQDIRLWQVLDSWKNICSKPKTQREQIFLSTFRHANVWCTLFLCHSCGCFTLSAWSEGTRRWWASSS